MFGFSRKTKKLRGMQLIDSVANRFGDMITELEEGVCQCNDERASISEQIDQLEIYDEKLDKSSIKASKIVHNLRVLLGD